MKSALMLTFSLVLIGVSAVAFATPQGDVTAGEFYALSETQPAQALSDHELAAVEGAAPVAIPIIGTAGLVNLTVFVDDTLNDVRVRVIRDVTVNDVNVFVLGACRNC